MLPPMPKLNYQKPTSIRLTDSMIQKLDAIHNQTAITRSALIGLAVAAFVDYVGRTGKLPVTLPVIKKERIADVA